MNHTTYPRIEFKFRVGVLLYPDGKWKHGLGYGTWIVYDSYYPVKNRFVQSGDSCIYTTRDLTDVIEICKASLTSMEKLFEIATGCEPEDFLVLKRLTFKYSTVDIFHMAWFERERFKYEVKLYRLMDGE